jgi:hypothetical protein
MRLITKSSKSQSRGAKPAKRAASKRGGLNVNSAEGIRFAYASTPLPGAKDKAQAK